MPTRFLESRACDSLASHGPTEVDPARQLGCFRLSGRAPLLVAPEARQHSECLGSWVDQECRRGGIGRRTWFRSTRSQGRGGSSPSVGTRQKQKGRVGKSDSAFCLLCAAGGYR